MPRKPRFYLPGVAAHVVQRGNSRQPTFFVDDDYLTYRHWLRAAAEQHGCAVHAYVLMTNHIHLLLTPDESNSISGLVQMLGRHYVTYVNRTYAKSGTLWEGRHKGCVISSDEYLLKCMRYIELNPVRAGMVTVPGNYRWSSFRANAFGDRDGMLIPHPTYLALGATVAQRILTYRELFRGALKEDEIHALRGTVQTGTPLGNERFKSMIEQTLHRTVGQARPGRPCKESI